MITRTNIIKLLRLIVVIALAGLIIAYAIWRSLNYARGPVIEIIDPTNGSSITSTTTAIDGKVLRVTALTLNGQPISFDKQGNWHETLIIFPGLNIITLAAHDQFGRNTKKELSVVGANR